MSEVSSKFFSKFCWKHDTPLQSLGIHYSGAFYSTLLSFFVLKIFGLNSTSLFGRYFGSISRFERFVQSCACIVASNMLASISRSGLLTFFNGPFHYDQPLNEVSFHFACNEKLWTDSFFHFRIKFRFA